MKWIIGILQCIIVAGFLMSGLSKIFSSHDQLREMFTETMGYEPVFMYIVGAVETLAALLLVIGYWRRTAVMVSCLLLTVIMLGAVVSSLMAELFSNVVIPMVYIILLSILFFAKLGRWKSRRTGIIQSE